MLLGIHWGQRALDLLLFVTATILLAVFAENAEWGWFWVVAAVATVLYALVQAAQSAPVLRFLTERAKKEHRLSNAFDQLGIADIYNMQVDAEVRERNEVCAQLVDNGAEFALSGSTGASYISPTTHRHWSRVRRKLDDGAVFRLLLTDPFSPAKRLRNELNHVDSMIDPKLDLANLRRLMGRYPNLKVRFTPEVYCSVFFNETELIYDPYHLGQVADRLENAFFALRLRNIASAQGVTYSTQLRRHFEVLWDRGLVAEEWFRLHSAELSGADPECPTA